LKKISIKRLGLLVGLMMTFIITKPAQADVILTPNDDFFHEHYEECEQLLRSYTVNGEEGYAEIKKYPKSKETVANVENGTEFYVSFTYTDDKDRLWGVVEYDSLTGWILMEDLAVIYDNISFMEEHKGEMQAYRGEFDDYNPGEELIQFYQYPRSGTAQSAMNLKEERPVFDYAFEDAEGLLWGHVNYYYTHRGWICLSDPTNANIPESKGQPEVTLIPPVAELPTQLGSPLRLELMLTVVLVVTVVIGTGVMIRIFWKKK
jgi:hypothetical protein